MRRPRSRSVSNGLGLDEGGLAAGRNVDILKPPLSRLLLKWYDRHKRDLPWRKNTDPYAIWVSEVMCQQTQVATVIPYYERWMARWPNVEALAYATEQEALSMWQGLGYYRRCRQLLEASRRIAAYGMPRSCDEWLNLPGVGPYTAAAIASIALGEPVAVADGNVERVFARVAGSSLSGMELKKAARRWAAKNLDKARPGDSNQALMELGAVVCTPKDPKCPVCPLEERCTARQTWSTDKYPVRDKKARTEHQEHLVWVPFYGEKLGVRQIERGQWWEGMWEFPRIDATSLNEREAEAALRRLVGQGWAENLGSVRHSVTRFRITLHASLVRCESKSRKLKWFSRNQLEDLPMPSPQRKVLQLVSKLL